MTHQHGIFLSSWVIVLLTAVPGRERGGGDVGEREGFLGERRIHPGFYKVNEWVLGRRFAPAQT